MIAALLNQEEEKNSHGTTYTLIVFYRSFEILAHDGIMNVYSKFSVQSISHDKKNFDKWINLKSFRALAKL